MKNQTKLGNNFLTLARKATLLVGTFGLVVSLNSAMAQCPTPTISASGPVDLCTGGSVTLTATAGASYLWSTGATTQAINVSNAGSYVVTVDDGLGCIVASLATDVTKNSATPGGINLLAGPSKACSGQSHVFTINAVLRAVYYVWTLPTGATISGLGVYQTTGTSVTVDFGAGFTAAGTIQIAAYNGCGNRVLNKSISLDIPSTPTPISGPTTTCAGGTYTFSTSIIAGVTTYTWTAPVGSSISGQGTNQVNITFPGGYVSGTVGVTNSNACGSSAERKLSTRSVRPKPQAITGPVSGLCGSTVSYSIPPVTGATGYTWTAPVGSTVTAGQGTTNATIFFNSNLNNGYVYVTADNICGSSNPASLRVDGEVIVTQNPVNTDACAGTQVSFSINTQGNTVNYQWQYNGSNLTNGGTISGANAATLVINPVASADAGLYSCIVSNNCSDPDTSTAAILTVTQIPATPGAITGANMACIGYTGIPYSISAVAEATNYEWFGFDGATIVSGNGTTNVIVDFGATVTSGFTVKVYAENVCGISDSASLWIRRTISTPNFSTAPVSACAGATSVAFDVTSVVGATTYTWTAPANATIATGQGTDAVTVNFGPSFTSGQICVNASNLCFTTPDRCKNIVSNPGIPGSIVGNSTGLCNSSATYTISPVTGATNYTWTVPTGSTITAGQTTNSINVDFGPTFVFGDVTVIAKNSCGDSPIKVKQVAAAPTKPVAVIGNAAPCANSTGNVYSVALVPSATSYDWTVPAGATITSGIGTNSITVSFGNTGGLINAKAVNACGASNGTTKSISFSCRIQASESNNGFTVYPNPADDRIIISNENGAEGKVIISISDVAGRNLINQVGDFSNGTTEIDITSLKAGSYIMESTTPNGKFVSRFVKK